MLCSQLARDGLGGAAGARIARHVRARSGVEETAGLEAEADLVGFRVNRVSGRGRGRGGVDVGFGFRLRVGVRSHRA